MATRTLTVKTGGGSNFTTGWHTKTITKAEYGEYGESKFLDVWFEDLPESLNMRVYANVNSSGEEWAIGNVFRYANAGITGALEGQNNTKVIKISDDTAELIGKTVNIYIHKDGKYSRVLNQCVPTEFENVVEKFAANDVQYWKDRAEAYFMKYVKPKIDKKAAEQAEMTGTDSVNSDVEVPF